MQGATVLRVNLGTGQIRKEAVPEQMIKDFIGGRGVGSKLLMDNMDPKVDAFDPRESTDFCYWPGDGHLCADGRTLHGDYQVSSDRSDCLL